LHVMALARELNIKNVLIPRHPGVLSARGLLRAPIEHEVSMAFPRSFAGLTLDQIREALAGLDGQCAKLTALEGLKPDETDIHHFADMCHTGQSYHLEIPLHLDDPDPLDRLYREFLAAHDRVHGYSTESPASIVNLRTTHQSRNHGSLSDTPYEPSGGETQKGVRVIRLSDRLKPVQVPVYDREALLVGMEFEGPAIIEQADTTTLVEPDWRGKVTESGNLLLAMRRELAR